jgi:hypothetical protein
LGAAFLYQFKAIGLLAHLTLGAELRHNAMWPPIRNALLLPAFLWWHRICLDVRQLRLSWPAVPNLEWRPLVVRFTQAIALSAATIAVLQTTAAYALQPLGVSLGAPLGTSLPFAGGGILAVAAVAVVGGIFLKRRRR